MYRVLAFDPGGTTGWASYTAQEITNTEGEKEYYQEEWACGQIGPQEHHQQLVTFIELQHTQQFTVVSESFEYRNRARPGLVLLSVEYIGLIKWLGQDRDFPVVMQTASMAKGFVEDKKLQDANLYKKGLRHGMDAMRHLLYYLTVSKEGPKRTDLIKRFWK